MASRKGIRQSGELPLRRVDFQFSIKRMLIAMTACAVLLAIVRPANVDQTGIVFLLIIVVVVILFNDWSLIDLKRANKIMQMGDYAQAVAIYTRAIQANPDSPDRYCFRAVAYLRRNELDAAAADYAEAIRRQSRYAPAWEGRASVELSARQLPTGSRRCDDCLCLAPDNVDAAIIRGAA